MQIIPTLRGGQRRRLRRRYQRERNALVKTRLYVECPWSVRRRLKRLREISAAVVAKPSMS